MTLVCAQVAIVKIKDEVGAMVDRIKQDAPNCSLRVAFVGYRCEALPAGLRSQARPALTHA